MPTKTNRKVLLAVSAINSKHTRAHTSIACAAVIATATGVASLTFAAPASAKTLVDQNIVADCRGGDCKPVAVAFTATAPTQTVALTNPGNPNYDCLRAVAEFSLDGQRLQSRFVGPNWEQPPFDINAAPGKHTLSVLILSQSDCKTGDASFYGARLTVSEPDVAAPPPAGPPPPQAPKLATVTGDVDVYPKPNINNDQTSLGILRAGKQVEPLGSAEPGQQGQPCAPNAWCTVKGPDVPTGQGVIWGHLQLP